MKFPAAAHPDRDSADGSARSRQASAQQYEYPDPFPGGYPSLSRRQQRRPDVHGELFPAPRHRPRPPTRPGRPTAIPSPSPTRAASGSSPPGAAPPARSRAAPATTPSRAGPPTAAGSPTRPTSTATSTSSVTDLATGESRRLTTHPFLDLRPRWSVDGSRVLFTTERDGTFDLWVHDLEAGAAEAVIADPEANDMAGDWIGGHRRHRVRLPAGRSGARFGFPLAVSRRDRSGGTPDSHRDQLPGGAGRRTARGHRRLRHGRLGQQRPLRRPEREVAARNPARPPHPHPHRRVFPFLVPGWRAPGVRQERRRRGPAAHHRQRDGVRALHGHPRGRRSPTGADRRLRLVRAHRAAPPSRQRRGRRAPAVPHLPDRLRRARLLSRPAAIHASSA